MSLYTSGQSANGHESRSMKTRRQLIEAAIDVFGRVGFEGTTTRMLAKSADVTLSAIPYHFVGKRELYMEAAREIADYAHMRVGALCAILDDPAIASPEERLEKALTGYLRVLLDDAEPRTWASFFARCAYDNDEALQLIHDQAIAPFQKKLVAAVRMIAPASIDDEAVRLRTTAIVTGMAGFRLLRGILLRGMDWTELKSAHMAMVDVLIHDLTRSDLLTGTP
ncbi:CerR family C-terminal domain-containing protein [Xanthobacter autotrophicus DSM 597]|uniref:CerR family C-terminal domain-containing protein n=1 Tax=Xanthobacter wiegelii TaxID=3119913 RepID=UPI003729D846